MTRIKTIAPGVWFEGDGLHLDPGPFLKFKGIPDTEKNREMLITAAKKMFRKEFPRTTIVDLFD